MKLKYFDEPMNPASVYLYDNTARMLTSGGPWREGEPIPTHFDYYRPGAKLRTKARSVEWYPDEVIYEPDFLVSNVKWSGTIVRHMVLQGFTAERIAYHLGRGDNQGGLFYRFIVHLDDDWLSRTIEGSFESESKSATHQLSNTTVGDCIRELKAWEKAEAWRRVNNFKVLAADARKVLRFVMMNPATLEQHVKDAQVVHGRKVAPILKALTEAHLISRTKEPKFCKDRRTRNLWTYRTVPNFVALPAYAELCPMPAKEGLQETPPKASALTAEEVRQVIDETLAVEPVEPTSEELDALLAPRAQKPVSVRLRAITGAAQGFSPLQLSD